jgi:hypothetical protein
MIKHQTIHKQRFTVLGYGDRNNNASRPWTSVCGTKEVWPGHANDGRLREKSVYKRNEGRVIDLYSLGLTGLSSYVRNRRKAFVCSHPVPAALATRRPPQP